ncbi:MAG: thioesterase domain-containing protein [Niallia nealsonii]|nr:thioesterase domain-containing protein [Niallia nealsonii]
MQKYNLFCLPHAGGAAYNFLKWKRYFDNNIDIIPIELAGRGRRYNEPFYNSFNQAIKDIYKSIYPYLIKKESYAILGHSMGAILAYELIIEISKNNKMLPEAVFISGSNPPNNGLVNEWDFGSDKLLLERINKLGGIKKELFNNSELLEIFLPIIKSDLKILDCYYPSKEKIDCNIITFNGDKDSVVNSNRIKEWSEFTTKSLESFVFSGDHFYMDSNIDEVSMVVNKVLFKK